MQQDDERHSWFGPQGLKTLPAQPDDSQEFARLWHAFMASRLALGLVLVVLQAALYATGGAHNFELVAISAVYFAITIATRMVAQPRPLGGAFNRRWVALVGIDVMAILLLQQFQGTNINYTPLFALPILMASVLGSLRLALGTAAGVTVLLLAGSLWRYLGNQVDPTPYYVQAALSGVGYFAIALLASQLSTRLASEGQRARLSQLAASAQRQVNELVIESLPDGVLIIDDKGYVKGANPAARRLLGSSGTGSEIIGSLRDSPTWAPLLNLTQISLGTGLAQVADVALRHANQGERRLRIRTQLAAPHGAMTESLCVLFLQDQRELEARMRTEKLASMGRMSTAVAHEIRNPLAAIVQANALLDEDLTQPQHKRLTTMVGQNAKRLEKIVDDILNVARISPHSSAPVHSDIPLHSSVAQICQDWAAQNEAAQRLQWATGVEPVTVRFDGDHLRRVLVNLLDNAARYASAKTGAMQVSHQNADTSHATLSVWSDGTPLEPSVERHLFEPFFSSESRSSGLGLYICRELCDRHGATIAYQRSTKVVGGSETLGNEFIVTLQINSSAHSLMATSA